MPTYAEVHANVCANACKQKTRRCLMTRQQGNCCVFCYITAGRNVT